MSGETSLLQSWPPKHQTLPFKLPKVPLSAAVVNAAAGPLHQLAFAFTSAAEVVQPGRRATNGSQVLAVLSALPRVAVEELGNGVTAITVGAPPRGSGEPAAEAAPCNSWLQASSMPVCSEEEAAALPNFSSLLRWRAGVDRYGSDFAVQFDDVVFLHGIRGGACLAHRQEAPPPSNGYHGAAPSPDRSATTLLAEGTANAAGTGGVRKRLILDSRGDDRRFSSCCSVLESRGMARGTGSTWLQQAIEALPWRTSLVCEANDGSSPCSKSVQYLAAFPKDGTCSASSKCPLVVQLPGDGELVPGLGDPWLLVQAHCKACYEELRAVLISPQLFMDGTHRTDSDVIEAALVPLVRSVLRQHAELDESRVYLVGQGRGAAIALHTAALHPHIFLAAVLSGTFNTSAVKHSLAVDRTSLDAASGIDGPRLESLQFHVGESDADMERFVAQAQDVLKPVHSLLSVDVRVYAGSSTAAWQGAFAATHDVIWTGQRTFPKTETQGIPMSCGGPHIVEAATTAKTLLSLVVLGAVCSWSANLCRSRKWTDVKRRLPEVQAAAASGGGLRALLMWPWKVSADSGPVPVGEELVHVANRCLSQGCGRGGGATRTMLGLLRPESDRPALVAAEETENLAELSHSQLYMSVAEADLVQFGVAPKERVVVLVPQGDLAAGIIVALMARYAVLPLNSDLRPEELHKTMLAVQARVVVATSDVVKRIFEFPRDTLVLVASPSEETAGLFHLRLFGDSNSPSRSPTNPRVTHTSPLNSLDDVALLLQTAGTTKRPRVLPHTLRGLALGSRVFSQAMGLGKESVGLSLLPLHNISGLVTNLLCVLLSGGCVVCARRLQHDQLLYWLWRHAVSYYSGLPSTHQAVLSALEECRAEQRDRLQLRRIGSGGTPLPHALALRLLRGGASGAEGGSELAVVPSYGTAECMPIAVCPGKNSLERPGSVGLPVAELRIQHEDKRPQRAGEHGEVMVRGLLAASRELELTDEPSPPGAEGLPAAADARPGAVDDEACASRRAANVGSSCRGLYGARATAPVTKEDWVPVGDLGVLDGDGFLFIVGRSREVINRAGELVSPFELEGSVTGFPGVKQCMAFAVSHRDFGEAPALALVSEQPEIISLTDLQQYVARTLSPHKVPEALVFLSDIHQFASGKSARIGFAARLGMPRFSSRTPLAERIFVARFAAHHHHREGAPAPSPAAAPGSGATACKGGHAGAGSKSVAERQAMCLEPAPWLWLARRSTRETEPAFKDSSLDSLGFARTVGNPQDLQSQRIQKALYGLCSTALVLQHSLSRGSLQASLAGERAWLLNLMEGIREFRPLLLLIFPLLGFFDGREALDGYHPLRRAPMIFAVYCAMAWPWFCPSLGGNFSTFHRWPLWVWLWCMGVCWLGRLARVSPLVQVLVAFGLAPLFADTPDNLHERLGLAAEPARGVRQDPLLLFLQHRFHFSVGTKLYFVGCYLVAYHYLAREGATQRILQASRCKTGARFSALAALLALGAVWQHCAQPFSDAASLPEVSDWQINFGLMYPLTIIVDWVSLVLILVAVGEGVGLLRLAGACVLGTTVAHMYIQLPLPLILQEATVIGGPTGTLVAAFVVPVLYAISVGRVFQAMLTVPLRFFLNAQSQR